MPRVSESSKSHSGKKRCPICEGNFSPQNIRSHLRKCERDKRIADEERERQTELLRMVEASHARLRRSRASKSARVHDRDDPCASKPHHLHAQPEMGAEGKEYIRIANDATTNNIRMENHTRSYTAIMIRLSEEHDPHRASTHHSSSGIRERRRTQ